MIAVLWTVVLNAVMSSAWFKEEFLTPPTTCPLIPLGHLQPFGYFKQPLRDVDIIPNDITVQQFNKLYVQPAGYRPGVFRGLQAAATSTRSWTDQYLNKTFGHYKVLTEVKHEKRQEHGKTLNKLSEFLAEYTTTNQYIVTVLPDEMRRDILMPQFLQCGTFSHNLLELNYWMASGNTASQVHFDADHNVHCLIAGSKAFYLMHPDQYDKLQMERLDYTGSNYCPHTNQNSVDLLAEPQLADLDYQWTMLHAGDCIFLPSQYMHQVRSYGRSISVTILWDPTIPFATDSIGTCTTHPLAPLSNFPVVWNHKADDIFFDVGYATPYIIRDELKDLWHEWASEVSKTEDQDAGWTYLEFINILFSQLKWELPRCEYTEVWVVLIGYGLDKNKDAVISFAEIERSSDEAMKSVSHFVDAPNLDNGEYDFCHLKYHYIPPEVISAEEVSEIEAIGSVVRWLQSKGFEYSSASRMSDMFTRFLKTILEYSHISL